MWVFIPSDRRRYDKAYSVRFEIGKFGLSRVRLAFVLGTALGYRASQWVRLSSRLCVGELKPASVNIVKYEVLNGNGGGMLHVGVAVGEI